MRVQRNKFDQVSECNCWSVCHALHEKAITADNCVLANVLSVTNRVMQHNCVLTPGTCVVTACLCAHMFATEQQNNQTMQPKNSCNSFLRNLVSVETLMPFFYMLMLWLETNTPFCLEKHTEYLRTSCRPPPIIDAKCFFMSKSMKSLQSRASVVNFLLDLECP